MKVQSIIGFFIAVRGKYSHLPSTNLLIGVSDEKQETGLANSLEETKDYRRGRLRLRLTVPALPPEHLRSARREEPPVMVRWKRKSVSIQEFHYF